MAGQDFRTLHAWVKKYFLWARIVLLKCALIVFERQAPTLERRFYALLKFLHERMARLPQFEVHVGYRFFALNSGASFFQGVQQNARRLVKTLSSMAWDLAHWRALFDMLLVQSNSDDRAAFPIPHFLTFDQPFVRLTEGLRLDGLIYAPVRRRYEQIPNSLLLRSVSELLHQSCQEFYRPEARQDRARRVLDDGREDEALVTIESELARSLGAVRIGGADA